MSWKLGFADDSSPDLIVHGVLGMERSMDQIREEMRGILERLVRIHPLLLFISTLVTATQSILWRYRPTPHQERDREKTER